MRKNLLFLVILCGIVGMNVAGCSRNNQPQSDHELVLQWKLTGFEQPESALYDARRNTIYISSINGGPLDQDGNGYISKVSPEGKLLEKHWITGLNAPKGLALSLNRLYVTDNTQLVEISLAGEKPQIKKYDVAGAKMLNDPVVVRSGADHDEVYVSDMMTNTIYRLQAGRVESWLQDEALELPNGLAATQKQLILASWGKITGEGFQTKVPGQLRTISLSDKSIRTFGEAKPMGNLDGVEVGIGKKFFVTDWMAGKILEIDSQGQVSLLLQLNKGVADLDYIPFSNILLVPLMIDGEVHSYKLQGKS